MSGKYSDRKTTAITRRPAELAESLAQQIISGVAVGEGDITRGLSGDQKIWTEDELRDAAETLSGGDVKALHSETSVGEVIDSGYVDGEGVVYEAKIEDDELAQAIQNGRLTVSVEARHSDGGVIDTDKGEAMDVTEIEFSDLAIVQHGAAPSASAEPGEAAALSPADIRAFLEDDPASTDGDPEDIDISDSVEEGLRNKVENHNDEVGDGKQVTLGQLKKVFRRGAGAWFSSNKGATQSQWAYARVNEALKDIRNEKAINHGNDNDIFQDDMDYNPPDSEQSAQLVEINGEEVDLEAPEKVKNAIQAAMDAKSEYSGDIGDCGTGVGEEMGQTILNDELTPDIVTSGGDIAQYGPSTYLDAHGDEGPSTDDPPTDWGRTEWLGIDSAGDSPRCGPVQKAMWGQYLEPFEQMKQAVLEARDKQDAEQSYQRHQERDSEMANTNSSDITIPEEYRFDNPGEAVEAAQFLKIGDNEDLPGNEIIHTVDDDGETVFMPGKTHQNLIEILRERDELSEHGDGDGDGDESADVQIPMPSEQVQLLYPEQSIAADAASAMGLSGTHPHEFEGEEWYMPGSSHEDFVAVVGGMDAGLAGYAPVARLNEYKSVGPIRFRGTREGELDESEIPTEDFDGHYFNAANIKSDSSYPLVDGEGYLRRDNLNAAWDLRGQGDLGMPRDSAERLMLNLGLIFGPPDSEANPLPQDAYNERDDVGTPYAAESAALTMLTHRFELSDARYYARAGRRGSGSGSGSGGGSGGGGSATTDDPRGEDLVSGADMDMKQMSTERTNNNRSENADQNTDESKIMTGGTDTARLGNCLANMMRGEMEKMMAHGDHKNKSEMMEEMSKHCGHSKSHMRAIARGDVGCPSMDSIEAMAEILDADMGVLVAAAERDGCSYSMQSGHGDDEESESMSKTTEQLKAELSDKRNRIASLEQRVSELEHERDQVAREYAESLAQEDSVVDTETLLQKFEVSELADMYEEQESVSVTDTVDSNSDPTPSVRGGDGAGGETENLSAGAQQRIEELESQLSMLEGSDSLLAKARREEINEELADIRGE